MNLHFVRSIRGLQNFLAIPIMNTLAGFMILALFPYFLYLYLLPFQIFYFFVKPGVCLVS